MESHTGRHQDTLYGGLAEKIMRSIDQGIWKPGDRIPSLRASSLQHRVSLNTAKEAYLLLERQGYLESRPQSGFFVRPTAPPVEDSGCRDFIEADPRTMSICSIYGRIMASGEEAAGASLAVALPDPSLLPTGLLEEGFRKAWKDHARESLDYQMPPGWKPLREAVARRLLEGGVQVSPEEILITQGASEALFLAVDLLCRPGDTVAVESPTYFNFLHLLENMGLKVLEIPSDPREGMNLEVLERALERTSVKAVIAIPNFSNPQGSLMPEENKERLVRLLADQGVLLIEDDTYGELAFDGRRPVTCKSWDTGGNVLLCGSLSKVLAPGLRIGWAVPGKLQKVLERRKTLTSVASSSMNQIAAAHILSQPGFDRHLKALRQNLARQSGAVRDLVFRCFPEGTRVSRPLGGLVLWVELPGDGDASLLYERGLREGILIAPGNAFSTTGRFRHCLRLNAGQWSPRVEGSITTLGTWAQELISFRR